MAIRKGLTVASIATGALVSVFVGLIHEYTEWLVPLVIFNLSSVLGIPGLVIVFLLTCIVRPSGVRTAAGLYPPYNYLSYIADFLFYAAMTYILLRLIQRLWAEDGDAGRQG